MTDKWDTPTLDELTDIDSRADQADIDILNGGGSIVP